jgi:dTDP-4-dehydrorhamnose reductase
MLVTGGSGYLGDWVVRLARDAWDVTATCFSHAPDAPGATWRRLDLRDAEAVTALVNSVQPAVIVHTAAANPGPAADFEAVNVDGTRHIAGAAARVGARLIHVSTDVIFDGERGAYTEADVPHPITDYGRSKAAAEAEVRASGVESVTVRTSLIYGWRPRLDRNTRWILESLRTGTAISLFTDELRNPIWVESLAAALVELAGLACVGALNVAGAQVLSRYELGVRLARFHGADPAPIIAASSRESGLVRPLDCTLDLSRARRLLKTPLPGVDDVTHSSWVIDHAA